LDLKLRFNDFSSKSNNFFLFLSFTEETRAQIQWNLCHAPSDGRSDIVWIPVALHLPLFSISCHKNFRLFMLHVHYSSFLSFAPQLFWIGQASFIQSLHSILTINSIFFFFFLLAYAGVYIYIYIYSFFLY